jgi:protoheme IX farnesyltransferase
MSLSATYPLSTTDTRAYLALAKPRLSSLVVFSAVIGYILASDIEAINGWALLAFGIGSFLITASANTINQIAERDLDKLMTRTCMRPLPTGRLSVTQAVLFTLVTGFAGLALLMFFTNFLTVLFAFLSLVLYAFVYTPLKKVSNLAVLVGAIPGALPPLIGWIAVTGHLGVEAFILFAIQFIWQFPHFWAIAWVLDDDYKKAGFRLLPGNGGRDVNTALQIMIYTLWLIPFGLMPLFFGISGPISALIATLAGSFFLALTFHLMKDCSSKSAKRIMFASFIYLPVVQISFLLDKIGS